MKSELIQELRSNLELAVQYSLHQILQMNLFFHHTILNQTNIAYGIFL
jgi:hypothetical protein